MINGRGPHGPRLFALRVQSNRIRCLEAIAVGARVLAPFACRGTRSRGARTGALRLQRHSQSLRQVFAAQKQLAWCECLFRLRGQGRFGPVAADGYFDSLAGFAGVGFASAGFASFGVTSIATGQWSLA